MTNKDTVKELVNKVFRIKKGMRAPHIVHPVREWVLGVFIALVIFSLSAVWSAYMYVEHRDLSVSVLEANDNANIYREAMVTNALENFSKRQAEHQQLLQSIVVRPVEVEEVTIETATSSDEVVEEEENVAVEETMEGPIGTETQVEVEEETLDINESLAEETPAL